MSAVLGVSAHYHDAAAALCIDGQIVAAMQEERFSRVKNDPSLPLQAIAGCLQLAGLDARALDAVVFYENPYAKLERVLGAALQTFPRAWRQFPRAIGAQLGGKLWVLDTLARALGVARQKLSYREHHASHAASAFYPSPFADAAVLTIDGVGEATSTAIWHGSGDTLRCVERLAFPDSLGLLYAALTAYLGFEVNEGEYKVMGLAAFGQPRFVAELDALCPASPSGDFSLGLDYFAAHTHTELGFGPALERLLGPRRSPGQPWTLGRAGPVSERDQRDADLAASLQRKTEDVMLALARRAQRATGSANLCLAGGVALNAVANARLAREAGFQSLWVQPAAGDAGGALGAAVLGAIDSGAPRCAPMQTAALGLPLDLDALLGTATALGLDVTRVRDPAQHVANALSRGQILAFAAGRFEFGPRALGQRSLLALPRPVAMRERLNDVVKRREPFRPFAPAVLAARAESYFGPFAEHPARFMLTTAEVRAERRAALAAVTHIDGSARLQTVDAQSAPALYEVLRALDRSTGDAALLNTSLNGNGEPICASAVDVLGFTLSHPIDGLIAGDLHISRRKEPR